MGSGKLIKRAIAKYGAQNFTKDIIEVCDTSEDMFRRERELITELSPPYNIHEGGRGGFEYINSTGLNQTPHKRGSNITQRFKARWEADPEFRTAHRENARRTISHNRGSFRGKQHSEEAKLAISIANRGKRCGPNNSQHGSFWITNGAENKKLQALDPIPLGWVKGRTLKSKLKS